MAKRDADIEPPEEELAEPEAPTVGQRLRAAREEKKLSLEDVAAQTRIPQRHLASIENAEWDSLPAPTYTIGFAKNYASAVDLDRTDIGNQLREEMGGQRFANTSSDVFEPAHPAQIAGHRRDHRRDPPGWHHELAQQARVGRTRDKQ